jgi:hypothetical protein
VNSKHVWARGKQAALTFEVLMLMMFLAFTLVLAYHAHLDREALWSALRLRRITLAYLVECWIVSLRTAAGAFSAGG